MVNLPTYEQVAQVLAEVLGVDTSGIGAPNTPASNVLTSNAHAKLNYLLNKALTTDNNVVASSNRVTTIDTRTNSMNTVLNQVNTNAAKKLSLRRAGSRASTGGFIPIQFLPLNGVSGAPTYATMVASVTGSGVIVGIGAGPTDHSSTTTLVVDGLFFNITGTGGYSNIPFSTSFAIYTSGSSILDIVVYALNV